MRRLRNIGADDDDRGDSDRRLERHRRIHEPEVVATEPDEDTNEFDGHVQRASNRRWEESSEEDEEAEELNEDDIEHRRMIARQKAVIKQQQEEVQDSSWSYSSCLTINIIDY